jgi:DNA-binding MarR family transcriptional regulator
MKAGNLYKIFKIIVDCATITIKRETMNHPNDQPETSGRLIACLYRHAQSYFEQHLAHLGLGSGTMQVLMILVKHDDLSQQELSAKLQVDKATITRAVTKLCKEGYVVREKDAADRRAYKLFVTQKARDAAPEIKKIRQAWTTILLEGFISKEEALAMAFLKRMRDNALRYKSGNKV